MPITVVDGLGWLTAAAYLLSLPLYVYAFCWRHAERPVANRAFAVFAGAAALHTALLLVKTVQERSLPFLPLNNCLSFIAWAIAVGFLYLEWPTRDRRMGVFVAPVALAFQALSLFQWAQQAGAEVKVPDSVWFEIHVGAFLFACSAFSLSGCTSLSYVLLSHEIRLKRLSFFFRRLPPLFDLERMNHRIILLGFGLLTLGIFSGVIWQRGMMMDPKSVLTVALWLLYAANLHLRYRMGWQGRRAAVFTLVNFTLVLMFIVSGLFGAKFH